MTAAEDRRGSTRAAGGDRHFHYRRSAAHGAVIAAEELGINLLLAGPYATETFGVKPLAAHLAKRFRVNWEFISLPTGL